MSADDYLRYLAMWTLTVISLGVTGLVIALGHSLYVDVIKE